MPEQDWFSQNAPQSAPAQAATPSPYAKPGPYLTQLQPGDESKFQMWVKSNHIPFDPSQKADYDMRGYYKDNVLGSGGAKTKVSAFDGQPHFPDTYKTPYHKTFSNESRYALPDAPHWDGDRLVNKNGSIVADETPQQAGSSDWFASNAPTATPPQPTATMQAAPTDATAWLEDVHNDLLHGGTRTLIGRALGHVQGRGTQGYTGLESGVGEGVANAMGSAPLGVVKAAKGVTQLPSHPLEGVGNIVSGGLQAATIPSSFAGPEISEAASGAVNGVGKAIAGKVLPSAIKERAAGLLQSVAHDANSVPVQLQNAGDAALRLMDWQNKTNLGPTVNKFLNRITNPKKGPMNYEEARDFYQLLGRLSVDETNKLAPPVRRDLTQMVVGLKQDIGDAADQVGHAAEYYKGMKEYAKGARLQEWYDMAKKYAIRGAITGATAVGAGTAAKFIAEGLEK